MTMTNLRILSAAVAIAACCASAVSAQGLLSDRKVISSEAAQKIVDACSAIAAKSRADIAIAVVDPSGNLLDFHAMEGATEAAITTAQLKAKTAARWRRTTEDLFQRVNKQVNRAPEWLGDFPQPGGYPLFVGGQLIGAVGAGGGNGTEDEDCAKGAIQQVFGTTATFTRGP
jgi:uncharacterized protein GlcG (DUF336 family)